MKEWIVLPLLFVAMLVCIALLVETEQQNKMERRALLLPEQKCYNYTDIYNLVFDDEGLTRKHIKRALSLDRVDCYNWQDIEFIVFGKTQE